MVLNVRHTLVIDGISYKKLYGESKASEITEAVEQEHYGLFFIIDLGID